MIFSNMRWEILGLYLGKMGHLNRGALRAAASSFIVVTSALFLAYPSICHAAMSYGTAAQIHSGGNPVSNVATKALDSTHFVYVYSDESNSDYGTAVIGTVSDSTVTYGDEFVFNTNTTNNTSVVVIDSTHFAVVYSNSSSDGKARIGTVSGNSISFGEEATFDATTAMSLSAKLLDSTHIAVAYSAYDGGYLGRAVVGVISDTTISFGSYATFNSSQVYSGPSLAALDATSFVITYCDYDGSDCYGRMIKGTVSDGTTLSFGSESNFSNSTWVYMNTEASEALDSTHVVVSYRDPYIGNSHIRAFIITVSGETLTAGTSYTIGSFKIPNTTRAISVAKVNSTTFLVNYSHQSEDDGYSVVGTVSGGDTISYGTVTYFDDNGSAQDVSSSVLDSTHFVVGYRDKDDSNGATSIIGTISGTDISFGSEYGIDANAGYVSAVATDALDSTHAVVVFRDGNSYGGASIATISGTDVSMGSSYTFNAASTSDIAVAALDSTHFIGTFKDIGNSNYGKAIVGTVSDTAISFGSEYTFNAASTTFISVTPLDSTHFIAAYRDSNGYGSGHCRNSLRHCCFVWIGVHIQCGIYELHLHNDA